MGTLKQNSFEGTIKSIINDVYSGMQNAGFVDHYIIQGLHTTDFELNNGYVVRIKETSNPWAHKHVLTTLNSRNQKTL